VPRLDEVFKKSGVPTHTFVSPAEYDRVAVSLKTPGRGIIIEGPSGIGKTSCVKRTIDDIELADFCLFLSARRESDAELIAELPSMSKIGVVVVDDFHRLPSAEKID
jgi:Holliday junction resolvasome RuvABC ATP-dependent DNA helicase subunit